jgi:hypothetical protein
MASNDIEFLNFAELFGIKLDDGNLDHNINKYNDFQNYRASSLHLGETFERACLKWKLDYDARQLAAAQPEKLNPAYNTATPTALTKIKQESPNTGDFYTFTLNSKLPTFSETTTTTSLVDQGYNTPTRQATDYLVKNHLQSNSEQNIGYNTPTRTDYLVNNQLQQQSSSEQNIGYNTPTRTDYLVNNQLQQQQQPCSKQNIVPGLIQPLITTEATLESCEMSTVNITPAPLHPTQPPRGKDIKKARNVYESRKRKREPTQRSAGQPTCSEVLTKIANESTDKDDLQIYSQDLILTANDGTEKEKNNSDKIWKKY